MVGNHDILHLYSDRKDKNIRHISLILNEFSYGKVQIPHCFCSMPLSKRCLHACCIFPHNLKQRQKVFSGGCAENYNAKHEILQYSFVAYEDKVFAHENWMCIKELINTFLTHSVRRYKNKSLILHLVYWRILKMYVL